MPACRGAFLAIILVLVINGASCSSPRVWASDIGIAARIEKGTSWILRQTMEYQKNRYCFTSGTGKPDEGKAFPEDNARVAVSLSNYHMCLTSDKYDTWLRASLEFVLDGQAVTRDFYNYYDTKKGQWVTSGSFYYWNARIAALLAQTAFTMRRLPEGSIEHDFWDRIIQSVEFCLDPWMESNMRTEGSWILVYPDSSPVQTGDVGMILSALSCVSGYEKMWGNVDRADRYSKAAQRTFSWIVTKQEMNPDSWGYGGYYDDYSRTVQTTLSNERTMSGLLAYWTFIGLTVPDPDYDLLRKSMIAWTEGFVLKTTDHYGGPGESRTELVASFYPKKTLVAAELIRDLTLIWVNLGGARYWSFAELTYKWLVGGNEMNIDMQQMNNADMTNGRFFTGIENVTYVDQKSTTEITSQCVDAMLNAISVDIPEFSHPHSIASLIVAASLVLLSLERLRRKHHSHTARLGRDFKVDQIQ
jgi:hypothetical protein